MYPNLEHYKVYYFEDRQGNYARPPTYRDIMETCYVDIPKGWNRYDRYQCPRLHPIIKDALFCKGVKRILRDGSIVVIEDHAVHSEETVFQYTLDKGRSS